MAVATTGLRRARRFERAGASVRVAPATALTGIVLVAVALAAMGVSLLTGPVDLGLGEVADALRGRGESDAVLAVREVRLPRAVAGVVAGAMFGAAGALTQTLFRNDLASPDIIGVQTGAALGAVLVFTTAASAPGSLAGAAFLGGLAAAALMWVLSAGGRRVRVEHVLVGVALSAMGEAAIAYLLRRADIDDLRRAAVWLAGDLTGVTPTQATLLVVVTVALLPVLIALGPGWQLLPLGDDLPVTLGARTGAVRTATAVSAVALTTTATAITGPVAFVALVAPHVGRRLAGQAAPSLWLAATAGAALVSAGDVVARHIGGLDLPVGVVTVALGAPLLLVLVVRGVRA